MIERIIALRGRGGIGKTTTIDLVPAALILAGWTPIEPRVMHGNGVDFTQVFENKNRIRLGVSSAGDNFREVDSALRRLMGLGATIIICACRTKDMPNANGAIRGTHTAMRQFTNEISFVRKTIVEIENDTQRATANGTDVRRLVNLI